MRSAAFSIWPFFLVGALSAAHLSSHVDWPKQPWRSMSLATLPVAAIALLMTRSRRFHGLLSVRFALLSAIAGALHVGDERVVQGPPGPIGVVCVEGTVDRYATLPPHYPDVQRSVLSLDDACDSASTWSGERVVCITPRPALEPPEGARVRIVGFLRREGGGLRLDAGTPSAITLVPSLRTRLSISLARVRAVIARRYDELLNDEASRLVRELILGESLADAEATESRRRAGVQHFFAVSGFHLTLVAALLFGRRRVGRRPTPWGDGFVACVLSSYAVLVGAHWSVLRALLVALLYLGARTVRRNVDAGWILLAAGALLVLFDPECVRSIGFLLSLSAVAGLHFLAGPVLRADDEDPVDRFVVRKLRERIPWILRTALVCSLAASLATAPAVLARFNGLSLVGFLANVLLLMPMTLLVVLGMALPFLPPLRHVIEPLVQASNDLIEFVARPSAAYVDVPAPSVVAIAGLLSVLVTTAFVLPLLRRRHRLWALLGPLLTTALIVALAGSAAADGLLHLSTDDATWAVVVLDGRAVALSDDPLFEKTPAAGKARSVALDSGRPFGGFARPPLDQRRSDDSDVDGVDRVSAIADRNGDRIAWSLIGAGEETLILTTSLDGPAARRLACSREPPARLALPHAAASAGDALEPLIAAWPDCVLVIPDGWGDRYGLIATARRHGVEVELLRR